MSQDTTPEQNVLEKGNPITQLAHLLQDDLKAVNALILERMQSPISLIPTLAGHLIAAGGKRLRPLLTLATARLGHYQGEMHTRLATSVEFIHTATLLHDDVVDESHFRRGFASANAVWGNKASVLVGDFLFSRAFELMVEVGSVEILGVLSSASARIAEGEVLQLLNTHDVETSLERYNEMIEAKTARLFQAACQSGAMLTGLDSSQVKALATYGRALGMAFQVSDDVLDYSADRATLGKTVGIDFKEGKITLPVILAMSKSSPAENKFWQRTLAQHEQHEGDFEEACEILTSHDALQRSLAIGERYVAEGCAALAFLPLSPLRTLLEAVALFTITRQH